MAKGTEDYESRSIRQFDEEKKTYKFFDIFVDPKELAIYGAGYYLFFDWLKHMIGMFIIMSIFAFFCMFFNSSGTRFKPTEITNLLDYTMLGNNGVDPENEVLTSSSVVEWSELLGKRRTRPLTLLFDYIYTVVAFCYVYYYNWRLGKTILELRKMAVNVSTFALQVRNLPPEATVEELSSSINVFGELSEVTISRDFVGKYGSFKAIAKLETKIRYYLALRALDPKSPFGYAKEIEDLRDQIVRKKRQVYLELVNKRIKIEQPSDLPAERAFVIFEKPEDKSRVLSLAVRIQRGNKLALICCCLRKKKFMEYNERQLVVEQCDEPNNIKFENLTQPKIKKFFTRLFIALMILVTISLNFLIIYGISRVSFSKRNSVCLFTPTKADIDKDPQNKSNYDYLYCYCRTLSLDALVSAENSSYCSEYYKAYSINIALSFASSLAILTCNIALRAIINNFGALMMFNTVSQELSTVTYLTSISEFLNYFAITILLRGSFLGFQPSEYVSSWIQSIHSGFKDDQPVYSDYNSSWYLDIGIKLKDSFLIEIVFPHILMLIRLPIVKYLRYTRALLAKIQFDVSENFRPSRYDIAPVTAHVISQIFVGLALSSGLPILIPSILFFLIIYYWIQKSSFLKYSQIPKQIDERFAILTGKLMYIAIGLHCYFGYSLYEAQGIFALPKNLNPLGLDNPGTRKYIAPVLGDKALNHHVFLVVGCLSAVMFAWHMIFWPLFESTGVTELCSTHPEEDLMLERAREKQKKKHNLKLGAQITIQQPHDIGEEGSIEEEDDGENVFSKVKDRIKHSKSTSYQLRTIPEYRELLFAIDMFSKDAAKPTVVEPPKTDPVAVKPAVVVNLPADFKRSPTQQKGGMPNRAQPMNFRPNQVIPMGGQRNPQLARPVVPQAGQFRPPGAAQSQFPLQQPPQQAARQFQPMTSLTPRPPIMQPQQVRQPNIPQIRNS